MGSRTSTRWNNREKAPLGPYTVPPKSGLLVAASDQSNSEADSEGPASTTTPRSPIMHLDRTHKKVK